MSTIWTNPQTFGLMHELYKPVDSGPKADHASVKSLSKALGILDTVAEAEHPLLVSEIAFRTELPRPTAHRLIQTLITAGYLDQDPLDGRVSVGYSVLQLAGALLDRNRLRLEALPHLQDLALKSGERVNLGILHKQRLLYLAGVEKPSLPTIYSRFGRTAPAHCCSLGKAILAYLPQPELQAFLAGAKLTRMTPHTISNVRQFAKELARIRELGYAIDSEEHMKGTFCVAAPIFNARNHPVAAIGLSGRTLKPLVGEVATLRHTAEIISHVL
jgi:DNA-binding IclR family transcriptional regulator